MKSTVKQEYILHILIPVFIAVLSFCVLANKVPESKFVTGSLASIEQSQDTVTRFAGVTLGASVAITLLPDDCATSLANTLADMNKYFVFILIVLFLERLVVVEGIKVALLVVIPVSCGIYVIGFVLKNGFFKTFACKLMILALAIILVIPCSTHLTEVVGADYLAYVDETIDDTDAGANKINDVMHGEDNGGNFLEKLSHVFETAIKGVTDLLNYLKDMIKKCMNSIAILIVTNFVIPLITAVFFKWLLQELFKINISVPGRLKEKSLEMSKEMVE